MSKVLKHTFQATVYTIIALAVYNWLGLVPVLAFVAFEAKYANATIADMRHE